MDRHAHVFAWTTANKEKLDAQESMETWTKNKRQRRYLKGRRESDPAFRAMMSTRSRLGSALRRSGARKAHKSTLLIGCTPQELKAHLEKQFKPGMTWENHGEWHIDHIIPCKAFNLLDPEEQRKCFHFSNLQPLWAADNFRKGDSVPRRHTDSLNTEGKDTVSSPSGSTA